MAPIPWIIIFQPVAPLQKEAYLAQSAAVPSDKKILKSLSLQTACLEAYQTVEEFVERYILIHFRPTQAAGSFSTGSSSDNCHASNFEVPWSVPTS